MTNMAISQIAVSRATNPQVRECAQMLVSDHGPVNQELKTFAAAHSVDLSMKTVNTDKWQKKDDDFDKDYVAKMLSEHKETVNLFEKQSTKGDNPELKAWAAKTLPALQAHLAKIESLKAMMK